MGKAKLLAAAGTEKAQTVVPSTTRSALTRNSRCAALAGAEEKTA